MRFVDLFAGLGGFHQALSRLGHECVFASERDEVLARIYEKNFGLLPAGDIRQEHANVPEHDILCAGFPCQPFSKAGEQLGFDCPESGDLFGFVLKVLKHRRPEFILLENVPNLMRHDGGKTWHEICDRLRQIGYDIRSEKLSPHMFGVPHIRDRAFIVGRLSGLGGFTWPIPDSMPSTSIRSILDVKPEEAKPLPETFMRYLNTWQDLLVKLPHTSSLPSFPIWAAEFGATYPIYGTAPLAGSVRRLKMHRGAFGQELADVPAKELEKALPPYARTPSPFPAWKIAFIEQNRKFYEENSDVIDSWLPSIQGFAASFQKLEWNWKDGPRDIFQAVIQFRASGIRVKRPSASPSLVALTTSQIPVIGWEQRYMTPRECSRLQSMGNLEHLPCSSGRAFKALGNAVNVDVVYAIAKNLLATTASKSAGPGEVTGPPEGGPRLPWARASRQSDHVAPH